MKNPTQIVAAVWKERRQYVAQCLNVDISSFGSSKAAAMKNLAEALELYFEDHSRKVTEVKQPAIVVAGV